MSEFEWYRLVHERRVLLRHLLHSNTKVVAGCAQILRDAKELAPRTAIARTIAFASGQRPDVAYLLRANLDVRVHHCLVDPDKDAKVAVRVSLPAEWKIGLGGTHRNLVLRLTVVNREGTAVWSSPFRSVVDTFQLVDPGLDFELPTSELPDGTYLAKVTAVVDWANPRAFDRVPTTEFRVRRSYYDRVHQLFEFLTNRDGTDTPRPLTGQDDTLVKELAKAAILQWSESGVYAAGLANDQLLHAEAALANLRAGRFVLQGMRGMCLLDDAWSLVARLPETGMNAPGTDAWTHLAKRPLVVVLSGRPAWDEREHHPFQPKTTIPMINAQLLQDAGFDRNEDFQLLVAGSLEWGSKAAGGLYVAIKQLSRLLPFDPSQILLVGVRDGGKTMLGVAKYLPQRVRGVVLVDCGHSLNAVDLVGFDGVPMLVVSGITRPDSPQSFQRRASSAVVEFHQTDAPAALLLPLTASRIESFARRHFAARLSANHAWAWLLAALGTTFGVACWIRSRRGHTASLPDTPADPDC